MGTSNKVLLQDKNGNKYYPHTMADVVHVDETKTIGDWVSTKETQLTQAQTNATTQANYAKTQGDYAKVQGGQIEAIATTIQDKVKINGAQTNVNFIENQVVQDGLVANATYDFNLNNDDFSVLFDVKPTSLQATTTLFHIANGFQIFYSISTGNIRFGVYGTTTTYTEIEKYIPNKYYVFNVLKIKNKVILNLNENLYAFDISSMNGGTSKILIPRAMDGLYNIYRVYNRTFSFQEIQHNLSVLNNTPSINRINDYAISTDTDHVQDRTGRVQDTINRVFYKNMCKEFSSSGEPIVVNNGMDGYLLSGKIEGRTIVNSVKNGGFSNGVANWTSGLSTSKVENNVFINKVTGADKYSIIEQVTNLEASVGKKMFIKASIYPNSDISKVVFGLFPVTGTGSSYKEYASLQADKWQDIYMICDVSNITGQIKLRLNHYYNTNELASGKELRVKNIFILDLDKNTAFSTWSDSSISNILNTSYDGLISTQATIYNNGMKYSFYSNLEDKLARKVIQLPFADDKIVLNEDGSVVYTDANEKLKLDNTLDWKAFTYENGYGRCALVLNNAITGKINERIFADTAQVANWANVSITTSDRFMSNTDAAKDLLLYIKGTTTIEVFKENLLNTPINIIYKSTPVITTIDKSLVPTILTQATNEFKFGDAVTPSKVTIQTPVNRIAEMQAQLDEIKALIQTPSNMNLTMNYIEDEYNKNQSVEGEM